MIKQAARAIFAILYLLMMIPLEGKSGWNKEKQLERTASDTIYINDNVFVEAGESLIFPEGSVVLFTGHFLIEVKGRIVARGSAQNPVIFTINDTAGFANPQLPRGAWNGFHFSETTMESDSSIFTYCDFSYTKALGDSLSKFGGVFNIRSFNKIRIQNCGFYNNYAWHWGGAIFGEYADIKLKNCIFEHNVCGQTSPPYGYGGAVCFRYSEPTVNRCTFINNQSTGIGGGVSFEYSNADLSGNLFLGNLSGLGGALGYMRSEPTKPMVNNIFVHNGCVFFGEAIACIRSNPVFLHNTIIDNENDSYGGVFYCNDSAYPIVVNSILYNDIDPAGYEVYIWDNASLPVFINCDIRGGKEAFGGTGSVDYAANYVGNIDSMPQLFDAGQFYGMIAKESPCVDAGTSNYSGTGYPSNDFRGYPRTSGQEPDMGAFEYKSDLGIVRTMNTIELLCYPNPFNDFVKIYKPDRIYADHLIQIFSINGRKVFEQTISSGTAELIWNGQDLSGNKVQKGIYLVKSYCVGGESESLIFYGL